jgi:hypothetical protein
MGGFGPGYEQAIQISCAEMVRWFIDSKCNPSEWSDVDKWQADRNRLDEQLLDGPGLVRNLGLSGAQWNAALSLASCLYRDGPIKVMTNKEAEDRRIQVSKSFPGTVAA